MNIGKEMLDSLKQFRDTLKDYRIDDLIAAYEKLPAYVTGERFVPHVQPAYYIFHKTFYIAGVAQSSRWVVQLWDPYYNSLRRSWWPEGCFSDRWTKEFYPDSESAQAEADRLNGEGE